MCVKLRRKKFQPFSAKETFSNWRLIGQVVEKMCVFDEKLVMSQKRWEIRRGYY